MSFVVSVVGRDLVERRIIESLKHWIAPIHSRKVGNWRWASIMIVVVVADTSRMRKGSIALFEKWPC